VSLKIFHLFFILMSTLLCMGSGVWLLDGGYYFYGIVALVASGGLIYYGFNFLKKMRGNSSNNQDFRLMV